MIKKDLTGSKDSIWYHDVLWHCGHFQQGLKQFLGQYLQYLLHHFEQMKRSPTLQVLFQKSILENGLFSADGVCSF